MTYKRKYIIMKNQLLNISRLGSYARFNFKLYGRSYMMQLLSIALAILGMLMFSMYNASFYAFEGYMTVFCGYGDGRSCFFG